MEDVLDVYARPFDEKRPVVCVDEGRKELRSTPREGLPMKAGHIKREDYEYERHGAANIFMAFEPLVGQRQLKVTSSRTRIDFAQFIRDLLDTHYPQAEKVVLISDNLNTHTMAAFYEAFEPAEARRLLQRIEWHYTPEHGSWLNAAEIELAALASQCLNRRIEDQARLTSEAFAWQDKRNAAPVKVNWQFTTNDARIKLRHLYPRLQ
jgi:transposase